jgi:hypothetical protein
MWPKGVAQVNDTSWTSEVHEGGEPPAGHFILSLYLVSGKGYEEIAAWMERGKLTGDYPGLGRIRHGTRLHSINLRLKSLQSPR